MNDALAWIDEELQNLEALELRRFLKDRSSPAGATIEIDGEELTNFSSNDYLSLASDPRLLDSALSPHQADGWGSGASPLIFGRGPRHIQLEQDLAAFEGTEAAMVFSSGYAANVGTISALVGRGDAIFSDEKNHASIIDGSRLSGARVQVYPHNDCDYLVNMLRQAGNFRRRLIVTDSLFSMDGDFAPLATLAELAEKYNSMLLVDEAHATGLFGEHGRGVCEADGVEEHVHVRVGTMSKALGCGGGFVVSSQPVIDYLSNRARSFVFSTAPPAPWCAVASAALRIIHDEPTRRRELQSKASQLRQRLNKLGWNTGDSDSQIIPVFIGEAGAAMQMAADLRQRGLLVPGIRPPSVPQGESLLRISLTWGHTDKMIDQLVNAMRDLRQRLPA